MRVPCFVLNAYTYTGDIEQSIDGERLVYKMLLVRFDAFPKNIIRPALIR